MLSETHPKKRHHCFLQCLLFSQLTISFKAKTFLHRFYKTKIKYTMHTEKYQLATQLNSQGATLTENGQYQEAESVLTKALKIFQQMMNERDDDVLEQHPEPAVLSLDQCMKQIVQPPPPDEGVFVYDSPLRIVNDKLSKCCPAAAWQQTTTKDSAIIIFNLALSLHLGAVKMLSSPQKRFKQLEKARNLYELAFQLEGEIEQANFRFMFAVTNNLGHVLKCLQKPQRAIKCFEHLLSMLMYVVDCSGGSSSEVGEIDGYLRNTSHLVLVKSTAAAA
jgi:tetratricopeptide (TPR) repeat protein